MTLSIRKMIARCSKRQRDRSRAARENPSPRSAARMSDVTNSENGSSTANGRRERFASAIKRVAHRVRKRRSRSLTFVKEVEKTLEPLIHSRDATAAQVSEKLGISRQTLYRRLHAENTNFADVLTAKRQRLAIRYLRNERVPVKVAAWRLGFSSPEAFSRAFKRWTGTPPAQFRALSKP